MVPGRARCRQTLGNAGQRLLAVSGSVVEAPRKSFGNARVARLGRQVGERNWSATRILGGVSRFAIGGYWSSLGKEAKHIMSNSAIVTDDLSTPGEILLEEFLEPLGVSQYQLAKRIGVDQARISRIVRGRQAITADAALRLSAFFGTTPQFWMRLQEHFDLAHAMANTSLEAIKPLSA